MSYRLRIRPEAADEIIEAGNRFEKLRPGLGFEFEACVEAELAFILRNPFACAVYYRDARRCIVRRFSFGIFYRVSQEMVAVEAFMHLSTNRENIKEKLK